MKRHLLYLSIFFINALVTLASDTSSQSWGAYTGLPIQVDFDPDGRRMHLLSETGYVDPTGAKWIAPKGWTVDGASIPQPFWSIIGGPFEGKYRDASVFHDIACDQKTRRWKDVHLMFFTAMRCSGVGEIKAKVMYYAVYHFGPRWQRPNLLEKLFGMQAMVLKSERMPATKADAIRIEAWIKKDNPSLEQIEKTSSNPINSVVGQ